MKKTDRILQYLASIETPELTSEIAAAIGEPDDAKNIGSLLAYLSQQGRVEGERMSEAPEKSWRITSAGREWFDALGEEAGEDKKPARVIHEAAQRKTAKAKREKAADPEKLAPLPRKKVQRAAAVSQAAVFVGPTPVPPALGRQIAVREDGAVLVIEDDVVITTLIPEDALRIARVVQQLQRPA